MAQVTVDRPLEAITSGCEQPARSAPDRRAVVAVVAVTLLLRLPSLVEPHHYADEGIFAAVAQRLLQGHALYAGAWDDKPPLIYWLYAGVIGLAGPSIAALRALAALWAAAGAVAMTLLGRRLFGARRGTAAGLLFAALTSLTFLEGNLALTELFAATPTAGGFLLLARDARSGGRAAFLAGVLFGVAFLFKQVAALDAAAAGVYLLLYGRPEPRRAAILGAGWVAPCAAAAAVLGAQGVLGEALHSVFGFYGGYLGEGSGMPALFRVVKFAPAALALVAAVPASRRRAVGSAHLITLWLGFACLGATLAGRPYGHYLLQVAAPASLCAVGLVRGRPAFQMMQATALVAVMVVAANFNRFWLSFPMVRPSYYVNVLGYITGHATRPSYDVFFYWRVPAQAQLAALIRADQERTLFVWGEFPWLYLLADAENPTRFTTSYHTTYVPGAKEEALIALREHPPRFIVWEQREWRRLPGLEGVLAGRYERVATVANTDLYRRRDTP